MAGRPLPLGGAKPRLLLATLLLQANTVVSTDALAEVLWPRSAPRSAAANIRTYVHSLRKRLDDAEPGLAERLQGRAGGYVVTVEPGELDSAEFEKCLAQAENAEPRAALSALDSAVGYWRGEMLADLAHSHLWSSEVARLTELRLSAQERRIRLRVELGEEAKAVAEIRELLAENPLREELWRQLVLALNAGGRRAEALAAYTEAEQVLREELDAEPGPALSRAHAELSTEMQLPVRQLPLDLPDFTGREELIGKVTELLERSTEPAVVVLSGAPGVGKSSIAVRVAHRLRDEFPDGQLHVDLRGTAESPRRPQEVLPELLRALGVPDPAMPRGLAERSALLRTRLASRRLCIVLDDAASAAQVRPLLPGTGSCAVLITSRGVLPGLPAALSVDVDVLGAEDAAALLAKIVGKERVAAEPEGAEQILRSCGHLPLAIRVAGAKLAHRPNWTLSMLARRLSDERRRLDELRLGDLAVRSSVSLSYDQLPVSAARAFRGLGQLGPVHFPAWAVAAVLDRPDGDEALDVLVDAHLVALVNSGGEPRYRLHDLLRCYAVEQTEPEDAEVKRARVRRVIEGYLALAADAVRRMPIHFFGLLPEPTGSWRPEPDGGDPNLWFEAELPTLVALVELAVVWGLDDLAWRLTAACTPFFDLRGLHDDWQRTHETALAAARRSGEQTGQAIVLRNLGQVALYQDDYGTAQDSFEEALRLFEEAGDDRGAAIVLAGLSMVRRVNEENGPALELLLRSLELFSRIGDRHGEAVVRLAVGSLWLLRDCHATAERWFTDAYELSAEIGDRHREARALQRIAVLHQMRGNLGAARSELDRAIAIFEELGDDHCVGYAHQNLGELFLQSGDLAHARLLLVNSLSVHRRTGDRRSVAEVSELLGELHRRLGQPARAREYYEQALAIWRELSAEPQAEAVLERLRTDPLTRPGKIVARGC
ncbi:tetratricopeptide repeat protein [Amycolatopsis acidicola]|uniref:Tetratricopeptide repeat protein n=1 Tax=Amycolatopsis acidicola TaxID=2596893 RepID=A0A5N0UTS8_9PSEU|nr:tetratricopeptide repeat protein [Amycolatopsis acidicola]